MSILLCIPPTAPSIPFLKFLKQCSTLSSYRPRRRRHHSPIQQRHFGINNPHPQHLHEGASVAILGGGITGLVSAFYLSRDRPDVRITLFEASERVGGWMHSTSVDVGTGKVVFEQGPRNLRPSVPNGELTLAMVRDLGLEDRLLTTSKSSPAAQNRFIYYPDHLVRMPGPGSSLLKNLQNVLSEPVFNGVITGAFSELIASKRPPDVEDESIGSFISRRFGSALADNIVSAVFHGIYAGDIYKLSARSILPQLWHTESKKRSILFDMLDRSTGGLSLISLPDHKLMQWWKHRDKSASKASEAAAKSSVFTFLGGIGELASRLEEQLMERENVDFQMGTLVEHIEMMGQGRNAKIEFLTIDATTMKRDSRALWDFSHVISTIAGSKLASIVSEKTPLLPLFRTKAVTVMVVNLFYSNPSIVPTKGFGYLLPRSLPLEQNPERALGVVFDSDASIGQDAVQGTKLTVMLGGHWWDDFDQYPDEDEGAAMAKAILKRHLKITAEPEAVRITLQKSCIPQYEVGHEKSMEQAHKDLEVFEGRLRVAGSSYTGVGLNDCVRAAIESVDGLVTGTRKTGLDDFVGGRKWLWVGPST